MEMRFEIKCIPPKHTAQGGKRILKTRDGRLFIGKKTDSKAQQTENELLMMFYPFRPEKPIVGPLKLEVGWFYPYRSLEPKKNRGKCIWCDKRPDADNILKFVCDIMTRLGFWLDDGQIADLRFKKCWDEVPRIEVYIQSLE